LISPPMYLLGLRTKGRNSLSILSVSIIGSFLFTRVL
jgi:hypothetical protein